MLFGVLVCKSPASPRAQSNGQAGPTTRNTGGATLNLQHWVEVARKAIARR